MGIPLLEKNHRKDMITIGVLIGIGAVIIEHLYAKWDYWQPIFLFPQFPFEDFYYGFIFGGVSAELYEIFFKVQDSKKPNHKTHKSIFLVSAVITTLAFAVLIDLLQHNSIIAHILPPLLIGLIAALLRKDLFAFELANGVLTTLLTFAVFQILLILYPQLFENHWMLENLTGINFFRIPIEELAFAFSVGFGASCFYEMVFGYSEVKSK
ncbi:hypothetical protein GF360_00870 [candidate division WWE3 bacterium]|nr:hypothetical protein [candidate division WWE3 bacterium]